MVVLITGASSGIGEACARTFSAAGHDLVLVARRGDRLKHLSESLSNEFGIKAHSFQLDVRDRQSVEKHIHPLPLLPQLDNQLTHQHSIQNPRHAEILSQVEVLINNAGLAKGLDPLQTGNPEDWDVMIDTNIKGLLYMTRAFLPQFIARGRGHIINLGSVAGQWVYEKGNVYCATKYAVRALTEGLRLDLRGTGIRVTEISPGMVETEFSEVRFEDKDRANAVYAGKKPLSAMDIAETVLWCVERPQHVNIQELVIFPTEQAGVHGAPAKK